MTLIAEDLFLLLVDDDSGKPAVDSTKFPRVLAGALVVELATVGAVRLTGDGEPVKKDHLVAAGSTPAPHGRSAGSTPAPHGRSAGSTPAPHGRSAGSTPADPLLRRAFDTLTQPSKPGKKYRPMKPNAAIEKLHNKLDRELGARLDAAGYVTETKSKMLGLFTTVTWPARDTVHEKKIRDALRSALVDGTTPSPHSAALISLISAVDATHKVIPDADKKAVKKRAKEIAEGEWAGEAVRKAVQDINAAVMTAVMVPVIVSTTSN